MRNWRFTPTSTVGVSRAVWYHVVCLDAAAMLWARCGHDSRVIFWGIISCQSFGYLWMYRVCLLSVEYQGRDDMLCNYYAELSVLHPLKAAYELLWRLLCFCLWWFIVFVAIHKQRSTNTHTEHHLCLTFSCTILNLHKWMKAERFSWMFGLL